ncbi:hypothetical protein [Defluviicoccus vanus]|uniref:Uncharacterized protein n=1 Tax=Defluviicoccus vanus TaxID=111831 RepID=A0A7H1N5A5_9PROT|nr:hypothetical protein [Defluviicoccus vanus]QNT70891.1 hypothetical protein HQ394_18205 [Defluviicoccus vanus]
MTWIRAGLREWLTPHSLKQAAISWLAVEWTVDQIADFTETTPETEVRIHRKVNGARLRPRGETLASGLSISLVGRAGARSVPRVKR